jgi:hypothetical protein
MNEEGVVLPIESDAAWMVTDSVLLVLVAPARTISNPVTHHVYGAVYAPA